MRKTTYNSFFHSSKSRSSLDSIANISINEAIRKVKSADGISPNKSFNDTASTVESDAVLLGADDKGATEHKGIFDGPMRSNTLSTNKFSTMNFSNLASQVTFSDSSPTSTINDTKEAQPSFSFPVTESKTNIFSCTIDSSRLNRRGGRATRRGRAHSERDIS